jgi:hypothetical protein
MKKLLVILVLTALTVTAQEAEKKKSEGEAMMEYYIEQAKPVDDHKRLAELAGPWKVTSTMWFGDMTTNSSGTASGKMILGGRFLELGANMKGELDAEFLTLMGFDRRTGEYTMIGLDTVGTYYITAAGKYDAAKKAITLHGSYAQPPSGAMQTYYFVWTNPNPREHLMTLYFTTDGKDVRVAETKYTRD